MKKLHYQFLSLIFLLNFIPATSFSQPDVEWVDGIIGNGYDETFDVALDTSRNVFICGQVEFTTYFSGYPLSTAGIHDIYLAKYSPAGALIWAKREGGVGGDKAISIDVDDAGNSYITGEYEEEFNFGSTHVVADAGNNYFIAKYDTAGNFLWVKTIQGGGETCRGYAISVDPQGNIYSAGVFREKARINGHNLFTSRGSTDVLIVKYNTNGDFIWAKTIGGSDSDEAWGIVVKDDMLYVTGSFEGGARFNGSSSSIINSYGDSDFFLAKFDTSGNYQWGRHGGSSGYDQGRDVVVNKNGEIVCTGNFNGNANFSGSHIISMGHTDAFIVSYDDAGNLLWTKKYGGTGYDGGTGLIADRKSNLYITGDFEGVSVFDSLHSTSYGAIDIFLAKIDTTGNTEYVKGFGGPNNERGRSCGVDKYGNIFVNGEFKSYIELDTFLLNGQLLLDGFLTRIGNFPNCSAVTQVTNPISCFNSCDGAATVTVTGENPFSYLWTTASMQNADSVSALCPGNYSVTVTDAYGCVITESVLLSQPIPLSILNANIGNITCVGCSDGSIDLTVNGGTAPYQFLWADGSTAEDRSGLVPGNYYVCITDSNNCNYCDSFIVGNFTSVINDIDESFGFKIFNDLQHGLVRIEMEELASIKYQITTTTGQILMEGELNSFSTEIDISRFSQGFYVMSLNSKQGRLSKALIKL